MQQAIDHIDTLIIGQGLAGSILAWTLMQQGQTIMLIADEAAPSASRVAAGIFNPVTGQRLVLQQHAESIIPAARQCYRALETQFNQPFFHAKTMLRVFKQDQERQRFEQRKQDDHYATYLGDAIDELTPVHAPYGLCEQQQTGYLDTNALLDCLRHYFIHQHCYIAAHFKYDDLICHAYGLRWRQLQAKRIIFCQGFMDQDNPWFDFLPFQSAKGEILTLTSHTRLPDCIINAGKWLLPLPNGRYKTGATYSHDLSNRHTSTQAKAELLIALQHFFEIPIDMDVIEQQAGIRPNTLDKQPFIGFHAEQTSIGIFNGFGSKGSMLIPYYAQAFSHHICHSGMIPAEADIKRIKRSTKESRPRIALTTQVHQQLLSHMQPEHISIDATAGNGHDTLFLARHTGQHGQVFAFDIQQQAIDKTHRRLTDAGLNGIGLGEIKENNTVTLFCCGHENMLDHLPETIVGKVHLIMFNLGYLPQANKKLITQTNTTLQALNSAIALLAPGGRISILAYPGHVGGEAETAAVHRWLKHLSTDSFKVMLHKPLHAQATSPQWMEVLRLSWLGTKT